MSDGLLILDFDGVIADSEALANTVLAEMVTALGAPTTLDDAYARYMGKRFHEVIAAVEAAVGRALPASFAADFQARTLDRFRQELRAVDGVRAYVRAFAAVPKCIASSSSPDRLALCLDVLGLAETFGDRIFSASTVARGKPHPDIFLHAAERMGIAPSRAVVVEDSVGGVQAGVAAGITVLAASHIREGDAERLCHAGAHHFARNFDEAAAFTRAAFAAPAG
ncbi:MAG: HAD-IA family hydrolase [Rhodospirillaceae bacterium]